MTNIKTILSLTIGIAIGCAGMAASSLAQQANTATGDRLKVVWAGSQTQGLQRVFFIEDSKSGGCWIAEVDAFSSGPTNISALAVAPQQACK